MSAKVNPSDSPPVSLSKLPMMSTKLSPSLASSARPSSAAISSNAPWQLFSLLYNNIRVGDKIGISNQNTCRNNLINRQISLVTEYTPCEKESDYSVKLNISNDEWRG